MGIFVKIIVGVIIVVSVLFLTTIDVGEQVETLDLVEPEKVNEELVITEGYKVKALIVNVEENKEEEVVLDCYSNSSWELIGAILRELSATDTFVLNMKEDNNKIIINFRGDSGIFHLGTAGETAILDSIAKTFIKYKDFDSVEFNVEGKGYSSGHFYFEKGEPYMTVGDLNGDK